MKWNLPFLKEVLDVCKLILNRPFLKYTLLKKKRKFSSHMYKEIQKGAVAKSYMTEGLLIYDKIFAHSLMH